MNKTTGQPDIFDRIEELRANIDKVPVKPEVRQFFELAAVAQTVAEQYDEIASSYNGLPEADEKTQAVYKAVEDLQNILYQDLGAGMLEEYVTYANYNARHAASQE